MSIKIKVYNQKAEEVGEMKLSDKIFGVKANEALVHQVAVAQMGNERQVLAHTKDRSEVRGGGKKPWRQKGTGRARAGSNRSPIWKGGGVTFGPTKDRNFTKNINKKMKQKALCVVLSDRTSSGSLTMIDKLEIGEYKTKVFEDMVRGLEKMIEGAMGQENKKTKKPSSVEVVADKTAGKQENPPSLKLRRASKKTKRSVLIVNDKKDEKVKYSVRNLAGVKVINLENINILDLLKYKNLILTKGCAEKLEEKHN